MPSPFSCCPVNREYAWKKTQIEKKISSFLSSSSFSVVPHDMPLPSSNGSSGFTQIKVSDNYLLIYSSFFLIFFKKSYCFFASEQIWVIENLKECFLTWKSSLKQSLKGRWRIPAYCINSTWAIVVSNFQIFIFQVFHCFSSFSVAQGMLFINGVLKLGLQLY